MLVNRLILLNNYDNGTGSIPMHFHHFICKFLYSSNKFLYQPLTFLVVKSVLCRLIEAKREKGRQSIPCHETGSQRRPSDYPFPESSHNRPDCMEQQ
jgi:hypothetical protein